MDQNAMKVRLEQWLPIFEAQSKSGLTKEQWCRENGIRKWEFYRRQKECRTYLLSDTCSDEIRSDLTEFFELPAVLSTPSADRSDIHVDPSQDKGRIDIQCGKFSISITGYVDGTVLSNLLRTIAHA